MPHKEQRSYIAGLIDGEGCLTIIKHSDSRNRNNPTITYSPTIVISMTDRMPLDFIQKIYGGAVTLVKKSKDKTKSHYKPMFRYVIDSHNKCLTLLNDILPYLLVKEKQAKILVALIKYRKSLPTKALRIKEHLVGRKDNGFLEQIRKLNHRGIIYA